MDIFLLLMDIELSPFTLNRYADKMGANRVFLVAPDEWKEEKVKVKCIQQPIYTCKSLNLY